MGYGFLEVGTSMATYAVPYIGIAANAAAFQSEAEDRLVALGASREDARAASFATAAVQAGADRLQLRLLRKFPGVGGLVNKLKARGGSLSKESVKFLTRAAAVIAAETGIEIAQDPIAPGAIQDLWNALERDVPDADWAAIRKEAADQIDDVALSMIIPSLLGATAFGSRRSSIDAINQPSTTPRRR